ncbi:hypothetical protein DFH11DRAFT_1586100 [Phellopilus nigrolimitatus]|nr:hypothetical protein DFH11DRAFT_1586100 [Phellopilus nigrolimitatus]
MDAFADENQSFSEANSSWASLVVDQVQNSLEDDDYPNILDLDSDTGRRSASVETHGKSRRYIDSKTFEQILQVMVQQSVALDNLRAELSHLRQERREELEHRDARLRIAEKQARILRAEKEKAVATSEELQAECIALRSFGKEHTDAGSLSFHEHKRIVQRLEDDATARVENAEAEKSHLTLQLTRFQIEIAQLRNQVDDRSYPEEVLQELTERLQRAVEESCQKVASEGDSTKKALSDAEVQIATLEHEIKTSNASREEVQEHCNIFKSEYNELHMAYRELQQRLAILESTKGQVGEDSTNELHEQIEQLRSQLFETEKTRDVALLDAEQLRTVLHEAEKNRGACSS